MSQTFESCELSGSKDDTVIIFAHDKTARVTLGGLQGLACRSALTFCKYLATGILEVRSYHQSIAPMVVS